MKTTRLLFTLLIAIAIAACSLLPNLPVLAPALTETPSASPTAAATLTPTITPTPLPIARIDKGDHALFNGEYETALSLYQSAFQDSPDPLTQAAAMWGEARIYFAQENYAETLAATQTIIANYAQSAYLPQAHFLQGFANYRLENYQAAADSWQTYLALRPNVLDAYVQELRGDALYEAQDYVGALSAYTAAIQADSLGDDINLDLKVAGAQTKLGNYETALALYDGIAARAPNDYIKAQVAYESGLTYQALGKNEEALGSFRLAVENYPRSYYAYLSLVALLDAGGEVSELDRGLVDYFNGYYDVAISAFDRYLASNADDGTAHYYRALALRERGDFSGAEKELSAFIENYPAHSKWTKAWDDKASIESYQGAYTLAAQTLLSYVANAPSSVVSTDYLMSAARNYERGGKTDEALQIWARVANEYPNTEQAASAIFLMGVIYYRNGDAKSALDSFNRSLAASILKEDKARAELWIGKSQQKLGDNESAQTAWRDAQSRDPGGYYSERARDLILERAPFSPPISSNLVVDSAAEKQSADAWMRLTFNLPAETDLSGLGALANDPRIVRGTELWRLGKYEDARAEFENLRVEFETNKNAEGSYRLTNYLLELGLYKSAISAARQTLTIAGLNEQSESMMAPIYFSHIRYGLYYADLVIPDAQTNNFDPLFLYSVVRQESLFEGFINSSAGARGLMQIMPSTGADQAAQLSWVNYTDKDLYRPDVSVAFGTHYLARNRDVLNNDLYATLAAYNAGPGNALQWKELAGEDPDLFLESVRFEETRNYIRNIYEIYVVYRRLYGAAE